MAIRERHNNIRIIHVSESIHNHLLIPNPWHYYSINIIMCEKQIYKPITIYARIFNPKTSMRNYTVKSEYYNELFYNIKPLYRYTYIKYKCIVHSVHHRTTLPAAHQYSHIEPTTPRFQSRFSINPDITTSKTRRRPSWHLHRTSGAYSLAYIRTHTHTQTSTRVGEDRRNYGEEESSLAIAKMAPGWS